MGKTAKGVHEHHLDAIIDDMIKEGKDHDKSIEIFHSMDTNGDGKIDLQEFGKPQGVPMRIDRYFETGYSHSFIYCSNVLLVSAYRKINPDVQIVQLAAMFEEADVDGSGTLELHEVSSA